MRFTHSVFFSISILNFFDIATQSLGSIHSVFAQSAPKEEAFIKAQWFNSNVLQKNSEMPLELATGCQSENLLSQEVSLESAVLKQTGLTGKEFIPSSAIVYEVSQFYKLQNKYYQMNAKWQDSFPPSYKVSLFFGTDAEMKTAQNVKIDAPWNNGLWDLPSVQQWFAFVRNRESGKGAVFASQAQALGVRGKNGMNAVSFFNNKPVVFQMPNYLCRADLENNKAKCDCTAVK